jgi:Ni2+-binding GTPase involved in maturation of urease and hydrogenase
MSRWAALKNLNEIRPGIRIFETSVKSGTGLEEWLGYLVQKKAERDQ